MTTTTQSNAWRIVVVEPMRFIVPIYIGLRRTVVSEPTQKLNAVFGVGCLRLAAYTTI
jgi:hypothetical protein